MVYQTRSPVWKYFEKTSRETVLCKVCKKTLKFNSSTTNMKSHLKSRHRNQFWELENGGKSYEGTEESDELPSTSVTVSSGVSPTMGESQVFHYQKLVVPMSMRSVYWKCYGFPANASGEILTRAKIVCLLCKNVISYNRNTSNLRMHLQNRHAEELEQLELTSPARTPREPKEKKDKKTLKELGNIYSTSIDGLCTIRNSSEIADRSTASLSFLGDSEDSIGGQTQTVKMEYKRSSDVQAAVGRNCTIESLHPYVIPVESKNVCDAIADFIVMDMQLPDVVEGRGFQRLVATLKSPCEIPSKVKLVNEVIPKIYDTYKESVQETLHSLKSEVSLTVEEWESAGGETYVTFSICYILEKEDILNIKALSTIYSPTTVDASYWNLVLDNLIVEWNINVNKVKAVVCATSRPEILEAIGVKGFVVLPCLVHTIQEICTRVCFEQEDMQEVLAKCRSLIYLMYKNNSALASLNIQDHLMSLEDTPLMSDYSGVWLSSYAMLEGMVARKHAIPSILDNVEPNSYNKDMVTLSDQDWALIEDAVNVLEPFKVTILTLSEEKSSLVSLLKPLLWQLVSCHLQPKENDSLNAQVFKNSLKSMLSEKYSEPAVNELLQIATALDPRFKSLPNSSEESKLALEGPIKEALTMVIEQNPTATKQLDQEEPEKKKPKLLGMAMLLGDMGPTTSAVMNSQDRASLEIVQFQSELTAPLDLCPVKWWQQTSAKFPNLAHIAAQYNCVPASALPSCRIPLEAQISYIIKRANMSPEIVDRLIFLNSNH